MTRQVRTLDAQCLRSSEPLDFALPELLSFARAFCHELQTVGICGITNCGLSSGQRQSLQALAQEFFDAPLEAKQDINMRRAGRAWRGYFRTGDELTAGVPDLKEGLYFGTAHESDHPLVLRQTPMHGTNQWPQGPLGHRMERAVTEHMALAARICERLLGAIAVGLGASPDVFQKLLEPEPTQLFRIFHYPPKELNPTIGSQWGVAEHTDMGFLTLLLQGGETAALEVKTRAGEWITVPPDPETFFVNIGDMLEYWSQGLLWSTPHRVRESSGRGRLSFPYFFDPAWTARLHRLDTKVLEHSGWTPELRHQRSQTERWDRLELHTLENTDYGTFVWSKIRHVFPWLVQDEV